MAGLRDATVVITGASSGIGWAMARAFARHGANLVLAARRRELLERVAAECAELGGRALVVPTDVTQPGQVRELATAAARTFDGIDVWINNAGIGVLGRFESAPAAEQARVVEVNLLAAIYGAHAALPYFLMRGGRGVIINLASVGSYFPTPYAATYAASKFGLMGFTDSLRFELASRTASRSAASTRPSSTPRPTTTPATTPAAPSTASPPRSTRRTWPSGWWAWRCGRRALNIGVPAGARVAGALLPDGVGRWIGRMARRKLMEEGPRALPTDGSIMRAGPEGTGLRGIREVRALSRRYGCPRRGRWVGGPDGADDGEAAGPLVESVAATEE
jgi:NAD(P)-dependent dehydrogenase (short-subunit alcohol dehydrogenase family)